MQGTQLFRDTYDGLNRVAGMEHGTPSSGSIRIMYCVPYAVIRRRSSVGVSPTRQLSLRPVAIGAAVAATKPLKSPM